MIWLPSAIHPTAIGILMKEAELWLRLIHEWVSRDMGVTGPTLPFLIGASRLNGVTTTPPDISDMNRLLVALHSGRTSYVRIDRCTTIGQPVATEISREVTMSAAELVRKPKCAGSLHVSRRYRNTANLEQICQTLWSLSEHAIAQQRYSFHGGLYGDFSEKDLAFIAAVTTGIA
jgi:hypothetical protein